MAQPFREPMTNRGRVFATFNGEDVDRFPVWLKMANSTWRAAQPEPFKSMDAVELLRACGCDALVGCGVGAKRTSPHVKETVESLRGLVRTVVETPDGTLVSERRLDSSGTSWHPTAFMADTPDKLAALRWLYRDTEYSVDENEAAQAAAKQKEYEEADIVTNSGCGPSPVMDMVEHVCGPENTFFFLTDEPELFREVVALMHADRMRMLAALMPHVAADTFWISENTSTSLISPSIFREFCMGHLADYARLAMEHGTIPVHHMCGTLNALLEMIDELPAPVNEAYTTRPLGDVSLAEGRKRMPSKALMGGTNATLWLKPPEAIVAEVAQDIAQCPDRRKIFLTSAGVLPPPVTFEKAKEVVEGFKRL